MYYIYNVLYIMYYIYNVLYTMGYDQGFDRWLYHVVSTNPTVQLQTPSGEKWFICLDWDIFKDGIWSRANNMGCSRPDSMGYFLSATMLGFSQQDTDNPWQLQMRINHFKITVWGIRLSNKLHLKICWRFFEQAFNDWWRKTHSKSIVCRWHVIWRYFSWSQSS